MAQNDPLLYRAGQSIVNAGKQTYAASDRLGKKAITSLGNAGSNVLGGLQSGYKQLGQDVARPFVSKDTSQSIASSLKAQPAINTPATLGGLVTQQQPKAEANLTPSLGDYSADPKATGGIPTRLGEGGNIEFTNADGSGQGSLYLNDRTPEENAAFAEKMRNFSQVNSGDLGGQFAQGMATETNGNIMEAMRLGDITTGEAQALRARDFNAADKIGDGNYEKPDERPTDVKQAMAYGQNLGNFTRNGELNNEQALDAQKTYMQSLGGFKGVANAKKETQYKMADGVMYPSSGEEGKAFMQQQQLRNKNLSAAQEIITNADNYGGKDSDKVRKAAKWMEINRPKQEQF